MQVSQVGNLVSLLVGLLVITGALTFRDISLGTTGVRMVTVVPT